MNYLDYMQLSTGEKIAYKIKSFFSAIPGAFGKFGTFLKNFFVGLGRGLGNFFKNYANDFKTGGIMTKLSYIVMGAGCLAYGQIVKGLIFLALEVAFIAYMVGFGAPYLAKFGTLGTVQSHMETRPGEILPVRVEGDNSMLILLFGTLTLILIAVFIAVYILNI